MNQHTRLNMWKIVLLVLFLGFEVYGQNYFDDLDTLGDRIQARVAAQVKPLEGLGDRINAQVQRNLQPLQVRSSFIDTEASGDVDTSPHEMRRMDWQLSGLGKEISQQVYKGLEPVRALGLNFKMRDGVGGTTIVTHLPSDKQFLIKDYKVSTCSSKISLNTGSCRGTLNRFEITENSPESDWCFISSYSQLNDKVCLSTGSLSVSINNHIVTCRGSDNQPVKIMTLNEYRNLCSNVSKSAEYRYISDVNDPRHVRIPNQNKHVRCENNQENVCIFRERNRILDSNFHESNGISIVQNRGPSWNF